MPNKQQNVHKATNDRMIIVCFFCQSLSFTQNDMLCGIGARPETDLNCFVHAYLNDSHTYQMYFLF